MFDLETLRKMEKNSVCLYSQDQVNEAIDRVAKEITAILADKSPLFLCTMNGAVIFTGQLLTKLNFPLQLDYIHTSRFRGQIAGGDLHWLATPKADLKERTIVIVEDILDSGITLAAILDYCYQQKAEKVYTVVLVDKDHPRDPDGVKKADFTGLYVEDKFLIGYGLDYQEFFRNLPGIYALE
jgi:hypoxanthine phosphoribosyltransferase